MPSTPRRAAIAVAAVLTAVTLLPQLCNSTDRRLLTTTPGLWG